MPGSISVPSTGSFENKEKIWAAEWGMPANKLKVVFPFTYRVNSFVGRPTYKSNWKKMSQN